MQRPIHGWARGRGWRYGAPSVAGLAVGLSALGAGFVAPPASAAADSYTVTATVAVGNEPTGVAVDPGTHTVYVENSGDESTTLSVIDETTNIATGSDGACMYSVGLAVDPTTHRLYSACNMDAEPPLYDPQQPGYLAAFDGNVDEVAVGVEPDAVAVDSISHTIYVANGDRGGDGTVSVVDGITNTVTATIGVGLGPAALAVDPITHIVYVANVSSGGVSVIDGATNTVTATLYLGVQPLAVGVDPTTDTFYVSGLDTVSVIDGATNTVTATIGVGYTPYSVGVDPTTHTIYAANFGSNSVSVIDGATNTVTATVGVGSEPLGVGVDPNTHTAYVANYGDNTVSVITRNETDHDLTIAGHPDLSVDATSPSGATVTFTPPAVSDPDDTTAPQASCTSASGGVFAIGETTVTCTATDSGDSNSPLSSHFTVTVVGAAGQLAALNTAVQGVGPGTSLADTVTVAQAYLAAGDTPRACTTLQYFINEVGAQAGRKISPATAQALTADAARVRAVLAC